MVDRRVNIVKYKLQWFLEFVEIIVNCINKVTTAVGLPLATTTITY